MHRMEIEDQYLLKAKGRRLLIAPMSKRESHIHFALLIIFTEVRLRPTGRAFKYE